MKNKTTLIFALSAFILLLLMLQSTELRAQQLEVDSGEVTFYGSTQIENFSGHTEEVTGSLDLDTGEFRFRVDLRALDTGNSRRDRNMHEDYLETEEYPYAEYEGKLESVPDFENGGEHEVTAKGTFTLKEKGREIEVNGTIIYDDDEGVWRVNAGFKTLLTDYDISRPRVLLVRMRDEVELKVDFKMVDARED